MKNLAIISSGDAEKDKLALEQAHLHDDRLENGICPNGCGMMQWSDEGYRGDCPECKFMLSTNLPYGIKEIVSV